jgi:hypothetical protein
MGPLFALPNKEHTITKTSNTNFVPFGWSNPHIIGGLQLAQHIGAFPYKQSWIQFAGSGQNFNLVDTALLCNSSA